MKKKNLILTILLVAVVLIATVAYYYRDLFNASTVGELQAVAASSALSGGEAGDASANKEADTDQSKVASDIKTGTDNNRTASDTKTGADHDQTGGGSDGMGNQGESDSDSASAADQDTPAKDDSAKDQDASAEGENLNPAPDFTVYDAEGKEVHLSDYIGRPVVLNFWASWCGPCKMEMPDFEERYKALGTDIQFMIVNLTDGRNETVEKAGEFIQGQGYTFPVFFDQDGTAAQTYGIYSIPTSFFIDDAGNVVAQATGAISADVLQRGIDMIYQSGE